MKTITYLKPLLSTVGLLAFAGSAYSQIDINRDITPGNTKPIWVSMSGLTGEAAQVLQFDLYVQGFGNQHMGTGEA